MRMSITLTAVAAALVIAGGATYLMSDKASASKNQDTTEWVRVPPGEITYVPPGEYLRNGMPMSPARVTARFDDEIHVMKRNVSQAEYAACVADGACRVLDKGQRQLADPGKPAVGISWRDATSYAQWLSARSGKSYRLPTYAEWAYVAGSAYIEEVVIGTDNPNDPAQRWLAEYKLEAQRKSDITSIPQEFGHFGTSSTGLLDIAGNIWDWTDTCHTRHYQGDSTDALALSGENCGVRVLGGRHISYITDFVRDPKSGACSVGIPPNNLGFRLVMDVSGRPGGTMNSLRNRLGIAS